MPAGGLDQSLQVEPQTVAVALGLWIGGRQVGLAGRIIRLIPGMQSDQVDVLAQVTPDLPQAAGRQAEGIPYLQQDHLQEGLFDAGAFSQPPRDQGLVQIPKAGVAVELIDLRPQAGGRAQIAGIAMIELLAQVLDGLQDGALPGLGTSEQAAFPQAVLDRDLVAEGQVLAAALQGREAAGQLRAAGVRLRGREQGVEQAPVCGGEDFQQLQPPAGRQRLSVELLHLGPYLLGGQDRGEKGQPVHPLLYGLGSGFHARVGPALAGGDGEFHGAIFGGCRGMIIPVSAAHHGTQGARSAQVHVRGTFATPEVSS